MVSSTGQAIIGVVYDPIHKKLYHAIHGRGVYINGKRYIPSSTKQHSSNTINLYADRSLQQHPHYKDFNSKFDIHFIGGAVMNVIHVMTEERSFYCKPPKKARGGCAIWDLASVTLMLNEIQGAPCFFDGTTPHLNRHSSIYFNDVGLVYTSPDITYEEVITLLKK